MGAPDHRRTTIGRYARFNITSLTYRFNQDCEAVSSGRSTAVDRGGKGFDETGSGGGDEFDSGKILVEDNDRDCHINSRVLKIDTGMTDGTIVVLASVIVMIKGHREGGKHH